MNRRVSISFLTFFFMFAHTTQAGINYFWLMRITANHSIFAHALTRISTSGEKIVDGLSCHLSPTHQPVDTPARNSRKNGRVIWNMDHLTSHRWQFTNLEQYPTSNSGVEVIAAPGTLETSIVDFHFLRGVISADKLDGQESDLGSLQIGSANAGYLSMLQKLFPEEIPKTLNYVGQVGYNGSVGKLLSNLTNSSVPHFNPNWGCYFSAHADSFYWALIPHHVALLLRLIPNGRYSDNLHINPDKWHSEYH